MPTIKKLLTDAAAFCLLFCLTGCPQPNAPKQPAATVIGTCTITNMDDSESTVTFYSDNTYTLGDPEDGVDLFMTLEQAVEAFGDIFAFAFIEQDYTVSGTTLINVTGDDGNDDDGGEDGDEPPSDEPAAIATFTESTISMTFIFYNDETYEQLFSKNTLATGGYALQDDETTLIMTPTTFAFYYFINADGPDSGLSDDVKYTQFTLEEAVAAVFDENNEITAPLREKQGITEEVVRTQLAYIFNSVSFGTLTLGADQNGKTLTVPESEYVFHEVTAG